MFNAGIRPAINVGISVSRVGGNAQIKAMRQVAGSLRLDMAQYRDLAAFAQFGSDQLDKVTQAQLARGQRLTEVLKQDQYVPLPVEKQVLALYVATSGALDSIPVTEVRRFEKEFLQFAETNYASVLKEIARKKRWMTALRPTLKQLWMLLRIASPRKWLQKPANSATNSNSCLPYSTFGAASVRSRTRSRSRVP